MTDPERVADLRVRSKLVLGLSFFVLLVGSGLMETGSQVRSEMMIIGGFGVMVCMSLLWWTNQERGGDD